MNPTPPPAKKQSRRKTAVPDSIVGKSNKTSTRAATKTCKPRASSKSKKKKKPGSLPPDTREQLFNEGKVGLIDQISVSTERIVKLRGILFDLDPGLLRQGPLIPVLTPDPETFYRDTIKPWLSRHPVLSRAEVRLSGSGIHVIIRFDNPVDFGNDADRDRWCSIVKIVQATLPTDPGAPGITATTRAIGSTNTKNNKKVLQLKKANKISPEEVVDLQKQMCTAPFRTLFSILVGADQLEPCPICGRDGSALKVLDHVGQCYKCDKVTFERLCSEVFQPCKSREG